MWLFGQKKTSSETKINLVTDILPQRVRDQIHHNDGMVDALSIRELMVPARCQQRFGVYATLKAASGDIERQEAVLTALIEKHFDFDRMTYDDVELVLSEMGHGLGREVNVKKLAEISRKDFSNWTSSAWEQYKRNVPEAIDVFLHAYTTVIAIDGIMRCVREKRQRLHILLPNEFESANACVGFSIADNELTLLARDFQRPAGAVVVDDIENTGKAREQVHKFWGDSPPVEYRALSSSGNTTT